MEILFYCSIPEYNVMLRHEASASDEMDYSCLRMKEVGKRLE